MIFEDDLSLRNKVHCYYLMGLGYSGLGEWEKSDDAFTNVARLDASHEGTIIHRQ
jgi:hypothetical protein